MINKLFALFAGLFLFFTGCAVKQTVPSKIISTAEIEHLKIGSTKSDIVASLGKSYRISPPVDKSDHEGWIYDSGDQGQRAAVVFDASGLVIAKIFKPFEGENEENLDFWLQKKFAELKFEIIPSQRCFRDYVPAEVYYINVAQGIAIEYNRRHKYVETIKWMSAQNAAKLLEQIKFCK